ncbi:MAG: hypothetical protein WCF18_01520 [Chthoniobacteraceae bacterium]
MTNPRSAKAKTPRKRATPAADGVKAAQTVYAKFLERADPVSEKPAKARR